MNKKAMVGFGVLVSIIFVVVGGGIIGYITYELLNKSSGIADNQKCKTSFFASAQLAKLHGKSMGVVDIPSVVDCERKQIVIDYDTTTRIGSKIDDEKVKQRIMQTMLDCWDITGSGKLDPSKANNWVFSEDQRFCLICAEISFSDKFQEMAVKQNYQLGGLLYYAASRKLPGQTQTTYEKIGGKALNDPSQFLDLWNTNVEKGAYSFKPTYAVVWRMDVIKEALTAKAMNYVGNTGFAIEAANNLARLGSGTSLMSTALYPVGDGEQTLAFGMGNLLANPRLRPEVHFAPLEVLATHKPPYSANKYCTYMMN